MCESFFLLLFFCFVLIVNNVFFINFQYRSRSPSDRSLFDRFVCHLVVCVGECL